MADEGDDEIFTVYCSSACCPDGYTQIDDANEVECEEDPCEESQCCDALCSSHTCPHGCDNVVDAATILCDHSGCTTKLCCECGELFGHC